MGGGELLGSAFGARNFTQGFSVESGEIVSIILLMRARIFSIPLALAALVVGGASMARAGTATDVTGLYYTGINNGGGLLGGGAQDSHWAVTFASVAGTGDAAYQGSSYVVSNAYIDAGWTQNTAFAQWIVPPGASTAATGGTLNVGGDYLPGNGTGGNNNSFTRNQATFVYTLAFNITGTGGAGSTVTNAVSISLTLSADDQYKVYVNPTGNGATLPTGTAAATGTSAWNNTTAVTLQNGTNGTGTSGNSIFVVGTNYISVVVDNTNSITTTSTSTAFNPSGLLVYQVGSATLVNGTPVPEVGTWLPLAAALGLYGWSTRRRSRQDAAALV